MAVVSSVLCDVTGEPGSARSFVIDGVTYLIDLSDAENDALVARLTKAAARYLKVARVKPGSGPTASLAAAREWAVANGYEVKGHGRVPAKIQALYAASLAAAAGNPEDVVESGS